MPAAASARTLLRIIVFMVVTPFLCSGL